MYISVDVGGTNTRVAGADNLDRPTFVTEPLRRKNKHDFEDDLLFMANAALQIADGEKIEAVGIGTCGIPNNDKTEIKFSQNLASWAGKPLVTTLGRELGCPIFYDDDVTAAGLGEVYYGHANGEFDYIIWGTGIGGAAIRYSGGTMNISAISWQTYFSDWEVDNGGARLAKNFGKKPEDFAPEDWEVVSRSFGNHLQHYVELCEPRAMVFGGGLAVRHAAMLIEFGKELGVEIAVSNFGDDSGLIGGFGLIRQNLER